jgi:hypothetical protein
MKGEKMSRKIFAICLVLGFVIFGLVVTSPRTASAALPATGGTATLTIAPRPDLIISSVVATQAVLDANGCALNRTNNTLSVTIQNTGAAAAGVFEVSATGRNLMYQAVPSLAAGASITLVFSELPIDSVNVITVDSTGLVAESNEGNNVANYTSPTLSPFCTATPTPIGFKSPTATGTRTPTCGSSGSVAYDHSGGAGMVNVPIMAANNTGTPNPGQVATTGPYGRFSLGCMAGKRVYGQSSGFTFNPTAVNVSSFFQFGFGFVANAVGVPSYTPTGTPPTPTPTPITPTVTPGTLPDLTVVSITEFTYMVPTSTPNPQGCSPAGPYSFLGLRVTVQNLGTANAGSFVLDLNGTRQTLPGLAAGQTLAVDFTGIALTRSRIATVDATGLVTELNETNNTLTVTLSAATPTRTGTPPGQICRTPTNGPSLTPTRTPTFTLTPTTVATVVGDFCSPVTSIITAPFTFDGVGTFCWQTSAPGSYINSWNTNSVVINAVNITNLYVPAGSYPARIGGFYYISYYSSVAWGHIETK